MGFDLRRIATCSARAILRGGARRYQPRRLMQIFDLPDEALERSRKTQAGAAR